jgi:cytochrome c7-like protein
VKRLTDFRSTYQRTTVWFAALMVACLAVGAGLAFAQTGTPKNFDHLKTGFQLTGAHVQTRCEACHLNGIFQGTPRDCASCHVAGARYSRGNVVRPTNHLTTTLACSACHNTRTYIGATFNHQGVVAGTCQSCHNGASASGKPANHIQTSASCDSCHRVTAWLPAAGFDHSGVVAGSCDTCHNGTTAVGKPSNHVPYASVPAAAAAKCDSCHRGSFATWANGKFHSSVSVSTGCVTCHTLSAGGSYLNATGKPATATHASVTGNCESCHKSTTTWAGAKTDHSSFTAATNCTTCHNGSTATGKPATHFPTTVNCFSCHNVSPSLWTPTKWNHTQMPVANACASCHTGGYPPADGKPTNHIPYQTVAVSAAANCDGCHKGSTTTWANGKFHSSFSVSTGCVSCHTITPGGSYLNATGKPTTATHTGVTGGCENCHKSTASWSSATFAHSAANAVGTGTCDTCHNGSTAMGKPANHIPITAASAKCDSCHKSQASFATSVTMNHAVVATQSCKLCHNGAYTSQGTQGALAKPANHIPEVQLLNGAAMECNACHTSTAAWTAMTMNHNNSLGNGAGWCKACHASGTNYLGSMDKKALTHRSATATDCSQSGCHRPLGNKGSAFRNWD